MIYTLIIHRADGSIQRYNIECMNEKELKERVEYISKYPTVSCVEILT